MVYGAFTCCRGRFEVICRAFRDGVDSWHAGGCHAVKAGVNVGLSSHASSGYNEPSPVVCGQNRHSAVGGPHSVLSPEKKQFYKSL